MCRSVEDELLYYLNSELCVSLLKSGFFTMLFLTIEKTNLNLIGLSEYLIVFCVTSYLKAELLMK